VLINAFARFLRGPHQQWGLPQDVVERYLRTYLETTGRGPVADLLAPSRAGEAGFRRWFAKCERLSCGPNTHVATYRLFQASDVTVALPSIQAPTLVLRRARDLHVRKGHAELLARKIPQAQLVELAGADHLWYAGDVEALFDQIARFLTGVPAEASSARVLTTVLFTDVVGSTQLAAKLRDRAWTELLGKHDELVRGQVEGFRGN
jgi:pimeloyl-ACP methyl ester carboxylesterase